MYLPSSNYFKCKCIELPIKIYNLINRFYKIQLYAVYERLTLDLRIHRLKAKELKKILFANNNKREQ